jgi:cytochrome c oxidase subunit 2
MEFVLFTPYRTYGFMNLLITAVLLAMLFVIILDKPLGLKTFEWEAASEGDEETDGTRHFLLVGLLIAIVTGLVLTFFNSIQIMPIQASRESKVIDGLFGLHINAIAFLFAFVMVFMLYSAAVFRRKPGDETPGAFIHGHTTLEIVWTAIPLATVLYFGYLGHSTLVDIITPQPDALEINVTAKQFLWSFEYPGLGENGGPLASAELALPAGRQILLHLESEDVLHSFWVPEFRVKQDAVPGLPKVLRVTPERVGEYKILCAELCGTGHAPMQGVVKVMEPEKFEEWVTSTTLIAQGGPGAKVAMDNACLSCHSTDGSKLVGPTWQGLYGTERPLADGTTVTADDAYLRTAIVDPNAQIAEGFSANIMPGTFGAALSEEDINNVIDYIKNLE